MPVDPSPAVGDQEPGPVGLLARLFLTQLLAVLAIATVIAVAFSLLGLDDRSSVETTSRQDDATPSAGPAESTPAATDAPPDSTPPASAAPSSPSPTVVARPPKVDVLNQSAENGTAESTADGLRDRGWRIGRVGDFSGNVRTTTIYFPPGLRSEARDLAAEFESEPRVLPGFSTLSPKRLTVVLVG